MTASPVSWPDLLQRHRSDHGDRTAFRFLLDDGSATTVSVAQLDHSARAIAATLIARGAAGERVVLAHPPGLDFVTSFLGCLYAGATAVPTVAPRLRERDRSLDRFAAILRTARPAMVVTVDRALPALAAAVDRVAPGANIATLASDTIELIAADDYRVPSTTNTLACLQYTSGTCGTPKGVMLTHDAFFANSAQIGQRFGSSRDSRGVIWLPPHHDMGLMGGILHPLITGFEVTLMSPGHFLQRPARWLEAISRYGATISGGPCFAYALALDSIDDATLATLDLSRWRTAFCGAERVRPAVMRAFAERFARAGFRDRAFVACYGMAEATLMLSAAPLDAGLTVDDAGLVDCGPAADGAELLVVDPKTNAACTTGVRGELWARSPALAAGYWEQTELTADAFGAHLANGDGPFLRTGDLGYARDGHFFITGRLKELIIVRGVNHSPEDLEHAANTAHAALHPHGAAAFTVDSEVGEQVTIVHELRREARNTDPIEIFAAIRAAIAQASDLEVTTVALVRPGAIPRTTSGKVQRSLCRELLASGELNPIHLSTLENRPAMTAVPNPIAPRLDNADRTALQRELAAYLCTKVATVIGIAASEIELTEPLARYGIGSADAVGLAGQISSELGIDLSAMSLWDYPSIAELTQHVIDEHVPTYAPQQAA